MILITSYIRSHCNVQPWQKRLIISVHFIFSGETHAGLQVNSAVNSRVAVLSRGIMATHYIQLAFLWQLILSPLSSFTILGRLTK